MRRGPDRESDTEAREDGVGGGAVFVCQAR